MKANWLIYTVLTYITALFYSFMCLSIHWPISVYFAWWVPDFYSTYPSVGFIISSCPYHISHIFTISSFIVLSCPILSRTSVLLTCSNLDALHPLRRKTISTTFTLFLIFLEISHGFYFSILCTMLLYTLTFMLSFMFLTHSNKFSLCVACVACTYACSPCTYDLLPWVAFW